MEEKAAVYCRLSQDDGSVGESGSIQTQRTLLTQYCKEQHISIADYYCDDGWSGTNFERPEFQRMLEDIESGKVNTVVVKDLSRFGREYAQMGMYIEHYFEQKNVRFISVAESIDSAKGLDNLVLPFTNVINSFYARQASTKTRAAHQARARSGMFMGSRAPFGYQKDPNDRHHLIVDPPAADVVRDIFHMLQEAETPATYINASKLEQDPLEGAFDFTHYKAVHYFLFSDLYDWAGQIRTVNISKKGTNFCPAAEIEAQAERIFSRLKERDHFCGLSHDELVTEIADFYCATNYLHPFREGNGRTQRSFLTQLIRHAGYDLNWSQVDGDLLMIATIHASQGVTDLLLRVLGDAIR